MKKLKIWIKQKKIIKIITQNSIYNNFQLSINYFFGFVYSYSTLRITNFDTGWLILDYDFVFIGMILIYLLLL